MPPESFGIHMLPAQVACKIQWQSSFFPIGSEQKGMWALSCPSKALSSPIDICREAVQVLSGLPKRLDGVNRLFHCSAQIIYNLCDDETVIG